MSRKDEDQDMICGLSADEHSRLRSGLESLPDTLPPRIVWERIRAQAEAEGLVRRSSPAGSWYLPSGLAAALLAVAVVFLWPTDELPVANSVTVPAGLPTNTEEVDALQALMVESRRLESDLRALPAEPRVMRAGTAMTIAEIEDRIAAIDYQLGDPGAALTADEERIFWRERVRLMRLLLGVRYAQAQSNTL